MEIPTIAVSVLCYSVTTSRIFSIYNFSASKGFAMIDTPEVHFLDMVGILGCAFYILNYTTVAIRRFYGESLTYFSVNIAAASMVLLSLTRDFNLASVVIQVFWIGASVTAIAIRLRRRRVPVWDLDQSRAAVSRTT
jgi:hypothetical protein